MNTNKHKGAKMPIEMSYSLERGWRKTKLVGHGHIELPNTIGWFWASVDLPKKLHLPSIDKYKKRLRTNIRQQVNERYPNA